MAANDSLPVDADGLPIMEVGEWAVEKYALLQRYVNASWAARQNWTARGYIDLYCGPGRVRVKKTTVIRDGGALVAWNQAASKGGTFTHVVIGDLNEQTLDACSQRLKNLSAPVQALHGPANETVEKVLASLPRTGLHLAYLDPFNLEQLPFAVIQQLSKFPNIDIVVHFSVMDLQREIELDFCRDASRFEGTAPGWKTHVNVRQYSKQEARAEFMRYWFSLVKSLGFGYSREMPLFSNQNEGPLYRMVFLMRHPLADKLWNAVATRQGSLPLD
jgi:three-Cys-motif partner protein